MNYKDDDLSTNQKIGLVIANVIIVCLCLWCIFMVGFVFGVIPK